MNQIIENKKRNGRAIAGIVLLLIGCALIANQFDLIPVQLKGILFTWQMLLILIGLLFLFRRDENFTGYILIGIGGFFLLPRFIDLPEQYDTLFWPVLLVLLGILLIFKSRGIFGRSGMDRERGFSEDYIDDLNFFGGHNRIINSVNFRGGRITSIFGGGTYDLSSAQLAPGTNVLDELNVFGGSKLIVPIDWDVKIEVVAIFGGFSDKRGKLPVQNSAPDKKLVIKGLAIFGGGEITS
jgi:predicted membrane protein